MMKLIFLVQILCICPSSRTSGLSPSPSVLHSSVVSENITTSLIPQQSLDSMRLRLPTAWLAQGQSGPLLARLGPREAWCSLGLHTSDSLRGLPSLQKAASHGFCPGSSPTFSRCERGGKKVLHSCLEGQREEGFLCQCQLFPAAWLECMPVFSAVFVLQLRGFHSVLQMVLEDIPKPVR